MTIGRGADCVVLLLGGLGRQTMEDGPADSGGFQEAVAFLRYFSDLPGPRQRGKKVSGKDSPAPQPRGRRLGRRPPREPYRPPTILHSTPLEVLAAFDGPM